MVQRRARPPGSRRGAAAAAAAAVQDKQAARIALMQRAKTSIRSMAQRSHVMVTCGLQPTTNRGCLMDDEPCPEWVPGTAGTASSERERYQPQVRAPLPPRHMSATRWTVGERALGQHQQRLPDVRGRTVVLYLGGGRRVAADVIAKTSPAAPQLHSHSAPRLSTALGILFHVAPVQSHAAKLGPPRRRVHGTQEIILASYTHPLNSALPSLLPVTPAPNPRHSATANQIILLQRLQSVPRVSEGEAVMLSTIATGRISQICTYRPFDSCV